MRLKLPRRWWLWAINLQFGDHLDEVQLKYFVDIAAEEMEAGDSVIVCMAKEVETGRKSAEAGTDRDLRYLEREVVERRVAGWRSTSRAGATTTAATSRTTGRASSSPPAAVVR